MPTPIQTPQKIAIIGAECTGKTTLAKALAKRFDTLWVGEYMRFYFDQQGAGFRSCLEDIMPIAYGQIYSEYDAFCHAKRFLFCDTNLILLAVYSDYYFNEVPDELHRLIIAQTKSHHYAKTLLTDDKDVAWGFDGQRDLPFGRAMIRQKIIDKLHLYGVDFIPVSGSLKDRVAFVCQLLEKTD